MAYTLNMWPKLKRCFNYGTRRIVQQSCRELDAPGCTRPQELMQIGSAKAGPKVAAILSVVESCKRLRIPVNDYMLGVLSGMSSRTITDLRISPPPDGLLSARTGDRWPYAYP